MLAGPAAAVNDAVAVIVGNARVGSSFRDTTAPNTSRSDDYCTAQTAHLIEATGKGLHLPNGDNTKHRVYTFKTAVTAIESNGDDFTGQLDICGLIDPVVTPAGPVGAACGISHGHDGAGKIREGLSGTSSKTVKSNHTGRQIEVRKVAWPTSAGGTLPITGEFDDYTNNTKTTSKQAGPDGTLTGVVQAQGGLPCVGDKTTNGAQDFTVVGAVMLDN